MDIQPSIGYFQWSTLLDVRNGSVNDSHPSNFVIYPEAIGLYGEASGQIPKVQTGAKVENAHYNTTFVLGAEVLSLVEKGIVLPTFADDFLYFELDATWRHKILPQYDEHVIFQASIDLAGMVMLSLPDLYLDPLWEVISEQCRGIIRTTVLPFLATTSMHEIETRTGQPGW